MGRLITFVFCCLSICYLASWSLSFPINYEKEKAKIRERVQHIVDPTEREDRLLQIAVEECEEKCEIERAQAEQYRARADQYKEEVGGLKNQKLIDLDVQLRFIPRALIDKWEEAHELEYDNYIKGLQDDKKKVNQELMKIDGKMTHENNLLNNPKLKDNEKKEINDRIAKLQLDAEPFKKELECIKTKLPPNYVENNRAARISLRQHRLHWIRTNIKGDPDVDSINDYLKKWYDEKPDEYRKRISFEQYQNMFDKAMAEAHDDVSVTIAHALKKFPMKPGYEFVFIPITKDERIDEFLTILINAVGLSFTYHPIEPEAIPSIIPHAVTRQVASSTSAPK